MPLETIGSYALAGSTGAIARGARQSYVPQDDAANDTVFAASSARGGDTGGQEVELPTPASSNVAVYLSPFIRFDLKSRLAIVEFRDSQTGAVTQQYPSPRIVEEYRQNLPESSDLLQKPAQSAQGGTAVQNKQQAEFQPRIFGAGGELNASGQPVTPAASSGAGQPSGTSGSSASAQPAPVAPAPAPASPAPASPAQAAVAAAAFSAAQNTAAPARELALA